MKAWLGDLPVGMLGDVQAMFSFVTGRGEFAFHIWILGPSEVCAVSWGKITFFIWILGLSEVCTHKHSQDNINNGNDDNIVEVENIDKSENATENNVEVEAFSCRWINCELNAVRSVLRCVIF